MTYSLIIGIVIVAAVIVWIFRSGKKESHHLDRLHINSTNSER